MRPSTNGAPDPRPFTAQRLVVALFSVAGASEACRTHGDALIVAELQRYYALLAREAVSAQGQVLKVIGDGAIVAFPPERLDSAVAALRRAQAAATASWRSFDPRCHVQVRVTLGTVLRGPLGPPGVMRDDLYGDALNALFKTAPGDFVLLPELATELA